ASPALGVIVPSVPAQEPLSLEPGDTIVLYTDGLVERREEDLDAKLAELAAVASPVEDDLEAFCDRVIDTLAPPDQRADDVALVAVRSAPAGRPERLELEVGPDVHRVRELREAMRGWLAPLGATRDDLDAVAVAVTEAYANAMEHGGGGPGAPVAVRAAVADGVLRITVADPGPWRSATDAGTRGHGLPLMRALMDEVRLERGAEGTRIHLVKKLGVT
ncbi:MAG: ATP-binding protein, partial [Solirubrobacterales bacterium]|nr:ATP-binding protein [Solirubrobacterales bacterium]